MFERFTDRARRVVVNAQEESRTYNHAYIGSEHLLLGLMRDSNGLAARVLDSFGITVAGVRRLVEEAVVPGTTPSGHMAFTHDSKRVLELALREAKDLGNNYIGTEHILLGLIREGDGLAARTLAKLGIDLEQTRAEVRRLVAGGGLAPEFHGDDRLSRIEQQLAVLDERLTAIERRLDS